MNSLAKYVDQQNKWRRAYGGQLLDLTTAQGRQEIADHLDSSLSPENLTCDGELPGSEVDRRYRFYTSAAKELLKLDPSVKMWEYA